MSANDLITRIFDAERTLRAAENELLAMPQNTVADVLSMATDTAMNLEDDAEASMRLERLAEVCARVPGPKMADALIRILDHDSPQARVQAAEALRDVGFDRYAELARAIERALDRNHEGQSMLELPWVLAEIGEPSALPLIKRFLGHEDGEVVASAIESIMSLGDPAGIELLQPLTEDDREVELDDSEDESATVGELALEAIAALEGSED
jgi:HEAT repeat protein